MKIFFYAVLHCAVGEFAKVAELCQRVINFLTENVAIYGTPNPSVSDLETELGKLNVLIGQAKGNSIKKAERDAQCAVVFGMLVNELVYVNGVAKGDKVKVLKSGFDADKEPGAHGAPGVPVISKIKDGSMPRSAKISLSGPLPKYARYSVQVSLIPQGITPPPLPGPGPELDPDQLPWNDVLEGMNSRELEVVDLPRGKDVLVRVRAALGSKKSAWSDFYLFMPR
jgi:hypothetical protein